MKRLDKVISVVHIKFFEGRWEDSYNWPGDFGQKHFINYLKFGLRKKIFSDNAFSEAMEFSLKVNTIHMDLYNDYHFKTNDLKTLIEQNIEHDLWEKKNLI